MTARTGRCRNSRSRPSSSRPGASSAASSSSSTAPAASAAAHAGSAPLASAAHATAAAAPAVPISRATRRVSQKRRGRGGGVPCRTSRAACGPVRRASTTRQMPATASATGTVMRAATSITVPITLRAFDRRSRMPREEIHMERVELVRDCEAVQIPFGHSVTLEKGTEVTITQSLGGSYTVQAPSYGGLFRIAGQDADALGKEVAAGPAEAPADAPDLERQVWDVLKTCYDPEIPVNIVDLGLVYDMRITPEAAGGNRIDIRMTLTAQGCGMG